LLEGGSKDVNIPMQTSM